MTTPDWRRNLIEAVRPTERGTTGPSGTQTGRRYVKTRGIDVRLWATEQWRRWVYQAAEARDVSVMTYLRRATAPIIAKDLGLTVQEVLAATPSAKTWHQRTFMGGEPDDGEGIEDWCPHPGCDGQHLRIP